MRIENEEEIKPTGASRKTEIAAPGFTRGPLAVGRARRKRSPAHVWIKTRSGKVVADVRALPPFMTNTDRGSDVTEANARLFAASPALYEAARFAASVLKANPIELSERMAIEKLDAALSLVDGPQTKETK